MAARITIDLSDEAATRLGELVALHNLANDTSFTLQQWVHLHLRELAIQRELQRNSQSLHVAEKTRLMGLV